MRGMFFDSCHSSLMIHFDQSRIRVKFLEDSADTVRIRYTVHIRHNTPIRVFGSSSCILQYHKHLDLVPGVAMSTSDTCRVLRDLLCTRSTLKYSEYFAVRSTCRSVRSSTTTSTVPGTLYVRLNRKPYCRLQG
jgi:hypothetical protein